MLSWPSGQGLLLMIPNMYKIAGELLPCVWNLRTCQIFCAAAPLPGDACGCTGLGGPSLVDLWRSPRRDGLSFHWLVGVHNGCVSSQSPKNHECMAYLEGR